MSIFDITYDNTYIINTVCDAKALRVTPADPSVRGDQLRTLMLGERIDHPVAFDYDSGSEACDFIFGQFTTIKLVSDRVVNFLKMSNFSGWSTYDVVLPFLESDITYYGLQITGRCPTIKYKWGAADCPSPCWEPFDIKGWDGSDFFSPAETTLPLITQRIYLSFKNQKFTNFNVSPFSMRMCR